MPARRGAWRRPVLTPRPRLVCLGNLTIDDVVFPDGSAVPGCIGGDALYAALAGRLWEPATEMVAPVGCDFPAAVLDRVARAGLSDAGLPARPLPTLRNRIAYRGDGGRTWTPFFSDDAFHALSPTPADVPAAYRDADAVLVLAMTLGAQEALVADLRRTTTALVGLDPQEDYIAGNEDALRRLIGAVDVFMPSAAEAHQLLGHADWPAAAETFAAWGPAVVVIKLGPQGCIVHGRGETVAVLAFPADVRDATGAGDCFCGAFMAALAQNRTDLVRAARAGAVAASFAVEGYGAEPMFGATPQRASRRLRDWTARPG